MKTDWDNRNVPVGYSPLEIQAETFTLADCSHMSRQNVPVSCGRVDTNCLNFSFQSLKALKEARKYLYNRLSALLRYFKFLP